MKLPGGVEESDSWRFAICHCGSRWWNHSFLRQFKKMCVIVRGMTHCSIDPFKWNISGRFHCCLLQMLRLQPRIDLFYLLATIFIHVL
ncbi:unnamed protein product [Lupinus luteus]|uniref:Uncharacterized protein n=1 Tax=Lupinus luteus TaxID=3873 RepID=A0AAV1WB68_LUPLU